MNISPHENLIDALLAYAFVLSRRGVGVEVRNRGVRVMSPDITSMPYNNMQA